MPSTPFPFYCTEVKPEWADFNRHMGVAHYHTIMNEAAWHVVEGWDFGVDYRTRSGRTSFILEMHARYLRELHVGDPIRCTVRILGIDAKRMHLWYEIFNSREDYLAATGEALIVSVVAGTRRVAPFEAELRARLEAVHRAHAAAAPPPEPRLLRLGPAGLERARLVAE